MPVVVDLYPPEMGLLCWSLVEVIHACCLLYLQRRVVNTTVTIETTLMSVCAVAIDTTVWPESKCSLPPWLNKGTWRDLSGHHTYDLSRDSRGLRVSYTPVVSDPPATVASLRCVDVSKESKHSVIVTAHAVHEW